MAGRSRPPRYTGPLDFRIFGVERPDFIRTELDDFHTDVGRNDPVLAVWLGHGTADLSAGVRVGTIHRRRLTDGHHNQLIPGEPVLSAAYMGMDAVVQLTSPDPTTATSDPVAAQLLSTLIGWSREEVHNYNSWPTRYCLLQEKKTAVKVWEFAGAWTALVPDLPDVFVVLAGYGVDPEDLPLRQVKDGTRYGINTDGPLDRHWGLESLTYRERELHGTMLPRLNRRNHSGARS